MNENISAADILAEYVSDEGIVTEWPHGSKQDAESVVKFADLLKAENAALREQLAARESDFHTQDTLLEKIAELQQRIAELEAEISELKQDRTTGGVQPFTVSS